MDILKASWKDVPMPHPFRFVATTYNLWGVQRWDERAAALRSYFHLTVPDVLCLQEFSEPARELLDAALPRHRRIDDPFEGWVERSNIYWNSELFTMTSYGAEDVGLRPGPRRLFWVRLQPRGSDRTLLVATLHLTYQGHERERLTGQSPRIEEARQTLAALEELRHSDEPTVVMGDLNESVNVIRMFQAAGYRESFQSCGAPLQPTHPARPTGGTSFPVPRVIDWQFAIGPIQAMNSHVGEFYDGDFAPSDHKPVVATYGMDL